MSSIQNWVHRPMASPPSDWLLVGGACTPHRVSHVCIYIYRDFCLSKKIWSRILST